MNVPNDYVYLGLLKDINVPESWKNDRGSLEKLEYGSFYGPYIKNDTAKWKEVYGWDSPRRNPEMKIYAKPNSKLYLMQNKAPVWPENIERNDDFVYVGFGPIPELKDSQAVGRIGNEWDTTFIGHMAVRQNFQYKFHYFLPKDSPALKLFKWYNQEDKRIELPDPDTAPKYDGYTCVGKGGEHFVNLKIPFYALSVDEPYDFNKSAHMLDGWQGRWNDTDYYLKNDDPNLTKYFKVAKPKKQNKTQLLIEENATLKAENLKLRAELEIALSKLTQIKGII